MASRAVCTCGWTGQYGSAARARAMAAKHVCRTGIRPDAVRRATRRYRCARCGLEAEYENAGATEARYWFSRHSCRKREDAMVRAAHALAREALVDRTPQPCLHKFANHQHGQGATYVLDKCRCLPCTEANAARQNERTRLKAYGRYHKYVPAEHVRAHLADLREYGIGLKQVSALSGVSNGSLTKIWYGLYADTGRGSERRHGEGQLTRGPSRRVLRSTAERIFDVEAVPANLGHGQADHQRTPTARLHLQALVALGWSQSKLATQLGMLPTNLGPVIGTSTAGGPNRREGLRVLSRGTVDKIEALYADLCMTLPPETGHRERISVARSRSYAKAHGWLPPLDLDDDGPAEIEPHLSAVLDEQAIYRRMHGDKTVRLTKAEKTELVQRWIATGRSLAEMERVTGVNTHRYDLETAS